VIAILPKKSEKSITANNFFPQVVLLFVSFKFAALENLKLIQTDSLRKRKGFYFKYKGPVIIANPCTLDCNQGIIFGIITKPTILLRKFQLLNLSKQFKLYLTSISILDELEHFVPKRTRSQNLPFQARFLYFPTPMALEVFTAL